MFENAAFGATLPASDVERVSFWIEIELAEKIFGGLTAADMEFIYRREIIDCYGIGRLSLSLDSLADRSDQVAMRIVLRDVLLRWHLPVLQEGSMDDQY